MRPDGVVLLGAVAASTVFGKGFRVTEQRGQVLAWPAESGGHVPTWVLATVHPSAVLRAESITEERRRFSADLAKAIEHMSATRSGTGSA
ncbi:MAG: phage polymerase-related protein [Marmoricola sp.]|nr:phage polymerase-related protein [Marmoricola sp.]